MAKIVITTNPKQRVVVTVIRTNLKINGFYKKESSLCRCEVGKAKIKCKGNVAVST
jgi:hypothetical protein